MCTLPQLLRDEIGYAPLHHACRLESIALARVLIESESGKRALLLHNNSDQKPIELCTSNFMKIRIEGERADSCRIILFYVVMRTRTVQVFAVAAFLLARVIVRH